MGLLNRKKKPAKFHIQTDFPVMCAFEVGGRQFFRYEDINNTPGPRLMATIKHYIRLQEGCDENYHMMHAQRIKTLYSDPKKINLPEMIRLNEQKIERLQMAKTFPAADDVLHYAAAIYFDNSESPFRFDDAYNAKKIEFWLEHTDVIDFFLQQPIRMLIPSLANVESYTRMYSMVHTANMIKLVHLENLLRGSSESEKNQDYYLNLKSQIMTLKQLTALDDTQLTNILHSYSKN